MFRNVIDGLAEIGVKIDDPLQLMLATRRLGAATIEELFNAGEPDSGYPRGFKPVGQRHPDRLLARQGRELRQPARRWSLPDLRGTTVVAAGTDVHEYALHLLAEALSACGAGWSGLAPASHRRHREGRGRDGRGCGRRLDT